MLQNTLGVIIWSEDPDKLALWYKDVLGFPPGPSTTIPEDYCLGFDFAPNYFSIGRHSEVSGNNKDPYRIMINFNVDSVDAMYQKIKDKAKVLVPPFLAPTGNPWCMTVQDPEGNAIQFFGPK